MVARLVLALVVLVALGTRAHAESAKLVEARDAISRVRYNDAQPLLAAALEEGGNGPADLIEIYRLSATTAIVLGHPDVAEQFYRRWLALAPDATLPDTVAPKLREPFKTAQTYMASRGRLAVDVRRTTVTVGADRIDVVIQADPLAMVGAVVLGGVRERIGADHAAHFDHVAPGSTLDVEVLDDYGNRLVDLAAQPLAVEVRSPPPQQQHDEPIARYRSPLVWAIPALGLAAVGLGFGLAASHAQADVAEIQAHPAQHFIGDLDAARSRRDRDALIANIGVAAGGVCAVTAVIMFVVRPAARVTVAAVPQTSGLVLVMSRPW